MIILASADLDSAAATVTHLAGAIGLPPDDLRCEVTVTAQGFGLIHRQPVGVEMSDSDADPSIEDREFAEFVAKIERAFAEALREVEDATSRLPGAAA